VAGSSRDSGPWPIAFALLFMVPTLVHATWCILRSRTGAPVAALAASDLFLALALSTQHLESGSWALPQMGQFSAGGVALTAAALMRLAAGVAGAGRNSAGLSSLAWWQGVALAAWPGPGARGAQLVAAGLLAAGWGGAILVSKTRDRQLGPHSAGFAIGGVAVLSLAALGFDWQAIVAAGLAGAGFALGDRRLCLWVLAALPLSPMALSLSPLALSVASGLFLVVLWALNQPYLPGGGGVLSAAAAATAATSALGAGAGWILAVAALAALAAAIRVPATPPAAGETPTDEPHLGSSRFTQLAAAGMLLAAAFLVVIRLGLVGMQTGFL